MMGDSINDYMLPKAGLLHPGHNKGITLSQAINK